ncbi:Gfo/Idh/MocA family protein [Roseivivax sediminis]|uniref:Predicted dehydrogenase n=1 Tax=Roseivivax sediminis TaxID=936889 RepID=A0A1I1W644_9RHOB|nr:Gfo/Idh/MocA family oxidoreductase [Roseivivax sediminis]SFD88460.1 Predicted dehydrogenase [Roseivivax sediminis]
MIRAAILGAGIGAQHLAGYRASPDRFEVRYLCDLDTARARAVAGDDLSIAVTDDLDAVLADPEVDLVDVCLPPHLHVPVATRVLEAGKHAICEKPIARSLAEADTLIEAEARAGKRIFPVFQYRYGLATAQMEALAGAGLAGTPFTASLETHWNRAAAYYDNPWRGTWARELGGAVLGHAIHNHDLLLSVFGPVAELSASTATRVNPIETEDCGAILMVHDSGALSTSSITLGAATDESRLRFTFAGFTAESGTAPYAPAAEGWRFTARPPYTQGDIDAVLAQVAPPLTGFAGYLAAIADALEGRGDRTVTLADGRRSIEFVTAVYQAARTGARVALPLDEAAPLYHGWLPGAV